ncbi:LppA family lipoprotein [Mycoplasma mycoides]|uniref:LppA family lipoprotein n=1 Tax=Mycoplasma mycoides TaxID=2102 RepID=UPI002733C787|nr:LppA family lipoprotein [Mycoplasma mycoides]MDP4040392.1 LppA family lipoprotein [Mycoplasma mycoides]MDP4041238.1 LppA family lipoprotein [Mycoplasma mycoides]MDP4042210.1 LppA family lipoprotein [Mycoplasma mycoides]MDP4043592.1 LppA family lipoprotein [Mycoplasma mycoides]MDP4044459.1 LppA family lipoprotein [Mycoplasma mycoides]
MRKFNKLFLTILPISSISAFSVISCTTNTKNNNQIPTIPNNIKPDNKPSENKPESTEEHTNKKPSENTNDQKQPNNSEKSDAESNPGKPENKPNNSHNPKQLEKPEHNDSNSNNTTDNNNSTNNDEPQHNQGDDSSNNTEEIFSDIDALKKEIEFNFYTIYKNKDALTSWIEIKSRKQAIFKEVIFSRNIDILEKYQIEFDSQNDPEIIKEKGIISNVKIKFTKNGKSKVYEFTFTGFKKENKIDSKNNKDIYIKQKDKIDVKLAGLYPSLLAYMLLYVEQSGTNIYDRDIKQSGNVINFDDLINNNQDLFDYNFSGFSVGTKDLLFDYNRKDEKLYKDKIVEAKYDDINGTLGLKVEISNRDDNHSNESTKTKEFNFNGFRKIDIDNHKNNPFTFSLLPKNLSEIIKNDKIRKTLEESGVDIHKNEVDEFGGFYSKDNIWETLIFKNLLVDLTDNDHHTYRSNKTLKVDYSGSDKNYKSILGLKSNQSLYPFHTIITKDSIKNILVTIKDKKFTLDFELHIPIYSTSFSNLLSQAGSDKILLVRVSQTTQID